MIDSLMDGVVPHLPLDETPAKRGRGANAQSPAQQQKPAARRAAEAAQARMEGSAWSLTKELSELGESACFSQLLFAICGSMSSLPGETRPCWCPLALASGVPGVHRCKLLEGCSDALLLAK